MEENSNSQEDRPSSNNDQSNGNNNSTQNNEKAKRHRRGKLDTANERTFKCPDCEKSYLSDPALVVHRKTKHGYVAEGEKRGRAEGRAETLIQMVKKMKAKGMAESEIAEMTGLSLDDIRNN